MDEVCNIKAAMRCIIPRLGHLEAIPMSVTGIPGLLRLGKPGHQEQIIFIKPFVFEVFHFVKH
jgi:hypothetical protein